MFVKQERVAITAAGVIDEKDITPETDVMFIRAKMDYGTRSKVVGAAAKIVQRQAGSAGRSGRRRGRTQGEMQMDIGAYQMALLIHNLLGWHGPSFVGVACVPENIERLDFDEPLVERVVQEITDRNVSDEEGDEEGDDPNVIELPAIEAQTKK